MGTEEGARAGLGRAAGHRFRAGHRPLPEAVSPTALAVSGGTGERRTGKPEIQSPPSLERTGISSAAELVLPAQRRSVRCLLRVPPYISFLNSFSFAVPERDKCVSLNSLQHENLI